MGSAAGPSIANIFVWCLESIWLIPFSVLDLLMTLSYIDLDDSKIESLRIAFGDLKLEMTTGDG